MKHSKDVRLGAFRGTLCSAQSRAAMHLEMAFKKGNFVLKLRGVITIK